MTAYLVAQFTVKDADALAAYSRKAGPTIASHGGELVFKSVGGEALDGGNPHCGIAVFRFPDMETLRKWHGSDDYRALIETRQAGADMVLTGYPAAPA